MSKDRLLALKVKIDRALADFGTAASSIVARQLAKKTSRAARRYLRAARPFRALDDLIPPVPPFGF
jgi:hypothetical protein